MAVGCKHTTRLLVWTVTEIAMPEFEERISIQFGGDPNTRNETVEWALGLLERALKERNIALVRDGKASRAIRIASGTDLSLIHI